MEGRIEKFRQARSVRHRCFFAIFAALLCDLCGQKLFPDAEISAAFLCVLCGSPLRPLP